MFYVADVAGWDRILVKPVLQEVRGSISAGTTTVNMHSSGMERFSLQMWRANWVTDQKCDMSTAANSILARVNNLAIRAADLENQFNTVAEFATLFPNEIPGE